ncbi:MAG: ATP-binding protein [Deltaproteobacteria bacterium]|nr:ATP-binding protein [Deltaproteobacteria bacterium]
MADIHSKLNKLALVSNFNLLINQYITILFSMNSRLSNVIHAQKAERDLLGSKESIAREQSPKLKGQLSSDLVKVITGPRRAGKSVLTFQVLKGLNFAYLNLEDNSLPQPVDGDDLFEAIDEVYGTVDFYFFDEIQSLDRWEKWINKLHRRGKNIIITGSNSKLLSKELATSLTGRFLQTELFPFSFREFVEVPHYLRTPVTADVSRLEQLLFDQYLEQGGFPEINLSKIDPRDYLKTLLDSIVLNDIINRYKIRSSSQVRSLMTLLINSVASRFSARSLERALEGALSIATIQKFLGYFNEAYVLEDLPRYFHKTRERLKADRKMYIIDNGFVTFAGSAATSSKAKLLENLAFIELRRRGLRAGIELFYYVTTTGYEVDFIMRNDGKTSEMYQVSLSLDSQKTLERELRSLEQAAEELKCKKLTLLVGEGHAQTLTSNKHQIEVIPMREWCLKNFS